MLGSQGNSNVNPPPLSYEEVNDPCRIIKAVRGGRGHTHQLALFQSGLVSGTAPVQAGVWRRSSPGRCLAPLQSRPVSGTAPVQAGVWHRSSPGRCLAPFQSGPVSGTASCGTRYWNLEYATTYSSTYMYQSSTVHAYLQHNLDH